MLDLAIILSNNLLHFFPVLFVFDHLWADFPVLEVNFGHFFVVGRIVGAPEPENAPISLVPPFDNIH